MIGRLREPTRNRDGTYNLTVAVASEFYELYEELKDHEVDVIIKKHSRKRSLDANAYAWVLIGQIAEKMKLSKTEVYRKIVLENGVFSIHCVPDGQLAEFREDWESLGLGFQVETFPSKIPGCTSCVFYKGTHLYNSAQMARLIEGIIQEAEALGIPTISDAERDRLLGGWKKRGQHNPE